MWNLTEFLVNSFENVTKHLLFGNVKPYVVFPKLIDNWWNITTFQIMRLKLRCHMLFAPGKIWVWQELQMAGLVPERKLPAVRPTGGASCRLLFCRTRYTYTVLGTECCRGLMLVYACTMYYVLPHLFFISTCFILYSYHIAMEVMMFY